MQTMNEVDEYGPLEVSSLVDPILKRKEQFFKNVEEKGLRGVQERMRPIASLVIDAFGSNLSESYRQKLVEKRVAMTRRFSSDKRVLDIVRDNNNMSYFAAYNPREGTIDVHPCNKAEVYAHEFTHSLGGHFWRARLVQNDLIGAPAVSTYFDNIWFPQDEHEEAPDVKRVKNLKPRRWWQGGLLEHIEWFGYRSTGSTLGIRAAWLENSSHLPGAGLFFIHMTLDGKMSIDDAEKCVRNGLPAQIQWAQRHGEQWNQYKNAEYLHWNAKYIHDTMLEGNALEKYIYEFQEIKKNIDKPYAFL